MPVAKLKKKLGPGRRVRVLVVDDSVAVRHLMTLALEDDPLLEVVGTASNGREALAQVSTLSPDVVTLDIKMPEMDGFETLQNIRHFSPQVRVVMVSMFTERGSPAAIDALSLGADDYLTKKSAGTSVKESRAKLSAELGPKIKQFFIFPESMDAGNAQSVDGPAQVNATNPISTSGIVTEKAAIIEYTPRVIAIGISTGGPTALASILHEFPADFRLPILIVQHIPPTFTKMLCERLQDHCNIPIREAIAGEPVKPGTILLAPGDYHMRVAKAFGLPHPQILLDQSPPLNSCRPAVDALFESLSSVFGGGVVAAILTGMGQDGLRGAKMLKKSGATIFAQDERTSTVWGMPRAIVEANIADSVLPLSGIVPAILTHCSRYARTFPKKVQGRR